jgi:surface polysaccharide O-acyltransferase-like enzyme
MPELSAPLFVLMMGFIATHELDAIARHEWRLFFFLAPFDDTTAFRIFTVIHIPLFAWIVWAAPFQAFQIDFTSFVIIHAGLHWLMRHHPRYEFNNAFSWFLIAGPVPLCIVLLGLLLNAS